MSKTAEKTNVCRLLDAKKVPYTEHTYPPEEALSGVEVAEYLHQDPARVFKTLVTVEKSGAITYVSVLKGLDESIDGEIVKLLEAMPRWTPATKNGVPVRYKVSMPINLRASRKGQKSNQDLMRYDEE